MAKEPAFSPNWVSIPGTTILECLNAKQLSPLRFGELVGLSVEGVQDLLDGKLPINPELAEKMSSVLGASTQFWINRDKQFRKDSKRLNIPLPT